MRKEAAILAVLLLVSVTANASPSLAISTEYNLLLSDLENSETPGYKAHFSMSNSEGTADSDLSQGTLLSTGVFTDLAILGPGLFKLRLPDGSPCFTRKGSFRLNQNLELENDDGLPLYDPIVLPEFSAGDRVIVNTHGEVRIQNADKMRKVGTVAVYGFSPAQIDRSIGAMFYPKSSESFPVLSTAGTSKIVQGALEMSNVHPYETALRLLFLIDRASSEAIKQQATKRALLLQVLDSFSSRKWILQQSSYMARIDARLRAGYSDEATGKTQKLADGLPVSTEDPFLESVVPFLRPDYQ